MMSSSKWLKCFKVNEYSLKTWVYIIACFGVLIRIGSSVAVSVFLVEFEKEHVYIYTIMFSCVLAYFLSSLITNMLIIAGVNKEKPNLCLPYIAINGIEVLFLVTFLIGGVVLFVSVQLPIVLSYFIPSLLFIFGISLVSWLCLVKLFKDFKEAQEEIQPTERANCFSCGFCIKTQTEENEN